MAYWGAAVAVATRARERMAWNENLWLYLLWGYRGVERLIVEVRTTCMLSCERLLVDWYSLLLLWPLYTRSVWDWHNTSMWRPGWTNFIVKRKYEYFDYLFLQIYRTTARCFGPTRWCFEPLKDAFSLIESFLGPPVIHISKDIVRIIIRYSCLCWIQNVFV